MKNIAIYSYFSPKGYSGGRIHAFLMGLALQEAGHQVTFITNSYPQFFADYQSYPSQSKLKFHLDSSFKNFKQKVDTVFVVPQKSLRWDNYAVYLAAVGCSLANKVPLTLLNFESEKWFNSVSDHQKPKSDWGDWHKVMKYCNAVLSSANESMKFAKVDYSSPYNELKHIACYPSINSKVADSVPTQTRENSLLFFIRLSDKHKNSNGIKELFNQHFKNFTIHIVVGSGVINIDLKNQIEKLAKKNSIKVSYQIKITDQEKYLLYKKAKAVVFLSSFEGFGLIPVEAQYCGTPCIAFDLPVLREVNKEGIYYIPQGNYVKLNQKVKEVVLNKINHDFLKKDIEQTASFESYAQRMNVIINEITTLKSTNPFCLKMLLIKEKINHSAYHLTKRIRTGYIKMQQNTYIPELPCILRQRWLNYKQKDGIQKVAVYGAGNHTVWLENILQNSNGPEIIKVIDDAPIAETYFWGIEVTQPDTLDTQEIDAIILSTDSFIKQMTKQCKAKFGKEMPIINLYNGLPSGPYQKN